MASIYCDNPYNLSTTYSGGNLIFGWEGTPGSLFFVSYRQGQNPWVSLPGTLLNSVSIGSLTEGKQYQLEVYAYCGVVKSASSYIGTVIPKPGTAAVTLKVTNKTLTTMTIEWTGPVQDYVVVWVPENSVDDGDYEIVNGNSYTIRNLDPAINYKIYVQRYEDQYFLPSPNPEYIDKDTCCTVAQNPEIAHNIYLTNDVIPDFVQAAPSASWVLNHNTGKTRVARPFTVGGVEMDGDVTIVSVNQTRIDFLVPVAGYAIYL